MKAMLDLHQALHNWPLLSSMSRWVMDTREEVGGWPVPSIPASLLIIAAHRFRHAFMGDAREVLDAAWLLRAASRDIWFDTLDAAGRYDLLPALYVVMWQAVHWFGGSDEDKRRVLDLRASVGAVRSYALEKLISLEAGVTRGSSLPGGFVGLYLPMPLAMTGILPPLVAMAGYTGSRVMDEVVTGGRSGLVSRLVGRRVGE